MRKRRRNRRKNTNPESVAVQDGNLLLPFGNDAHSEDGATGDGLSANPHGSHFDAQEREPGDQAGPGGQALEPDARGSEDTDLDATSSEAAAAEPGEAEAAVEQVFEVEAPVSGAGFTEAAEPAADEPETLSGEPEPSGPDRPNPELRSAVRKASASAGRDRRQHARFLVGGRTKGRVTAIYDARILDISPGGSLIEHAHVVRPGTLSCLDLDLLGKRMSLKCRVARSVVHRSEVQPDGDKELIYHTGLEFLDRSDETRKLIIDYIQSVIGDGNRPSLPPPEAQQES